jgi:TPP-dependent pyruvate/acetoin dehydrogenase alpha subunit
MISVEEIQEIEGKVEREIEKAIEFAENGTWEDVKDLTRFVYTESQRS